MGTLNYWFYVSTKATVDPVKTVFLCVPQKYSQNKDTAKEYAETSGWVKEIEEDAGVLVVPLSQNWKDEPADLLSSIYAEDRNSFHAPTGKSIPGRDGIVWTWETLIYLVGYEEGAEFAGRVLVKHPNMFAASLLVNGQAHDFSDGELASDHWLVKNPSTDYAVKNKDVPVALWLMGKDHQESLDYFRSIDHASLVERKENTTVYANPENPSEEIRVSEVVPEETASLCMHTFFNHVIRWKNSPDGTLRYKLGKYDFYHKDVYQHGEVTTGGLTYPYHVYLPAGVTDVTGLPLVFSIHGRGEPAWIFAEKNGWEKLADETKAFVTVFPDSPENIWTIERDYDAIRAILDAVAEQYGIDRTRVYITGFSNGAIFTVQQMSSHPQLFAAASPWNGPTPANLQSMNVNLMGSYFYEPSFEKSGYDMPIWICVGDNDSKAGKVGETELTLLRNVNGCSDQKEVWTKANHYQDYKDGDRFITDVYRNQDGSVRVGVTTMKNMPHGAVEDEARAAWEFMKRFRRLPDCKHVVEEK